MDGIICEDPPPNKNLGTPGYEEFLKTAKPLFLPTFKIYQIVTGRREKFRKETEEWLDRHNVKYNKLIMKETHIPTEQTPYFKADIFINSNSDLFIESDEKQAKIIAIISKKPVYYFEKGLIYHFR